MRSAVPGPQPPPGPRPPPGPPPPGHPVSGVRGAPGSAPRSALDPGGVFPTCLVKRRPIGAHWSRRVHCSQSHYQADLPGNTW